MASVNGLVPITRAFLAKYYDNYPCPPRSEDVVRVTEQLRGMSRSLLEESPPAAGEEQVIKDAELPAPHKMDHNMWKNREYIEQILFLLEEPNWPKLLQQRQSPEDIEVTDLIRELQMKLQGSYKLVEHFQLKNADFVFNTVMTYMPQDFRGSLIRQQRERSERSRLAEVDALVKSGGSIHDKYALLWNQQMGRRRQLAQLGAAQGVYKALVKYLVGVPQVLLDFVCKINDENGPMEEQRHRYGPTLYSLTNMVKAIRLFLFLSWGRYEAIKLRKDHMALLELAINVYTSELEHFLNFIGEVFANSPFLISAEEAGAAESMKEDDYKEIIIPPGKEFEVPLTVESVNSYIAWDFTLIQGKLNMDIGFSVEYISPSGDVTQILPYRRYKSDQGNFSTIVSGSYKLKWDNTYSTFFQKSLRYKVDSIPPVAENPESAM